jgi:3',5'-cyclic AMP phosphodiesterase CpdA
MVQWFHISDLQFGTGKAEKNDSDACARRLVEQVARQQPDFVIHSGDHIHGAVNNSKEEKARVKEYWADYQQAVKDLKKVCPIFSVPGNHDQTGGDLSLKTYLRQTGRMAKPPYYGVTVKGVHVLNLDVVPWRHRGGFVKGSPQEKWLRRHLRRRRQARCLVAVGHYPIFMSPWIYHNVDPSLGYDEATQEPGVLLPLLLEAQVDLYLCGHLHVYERSRYKGLTQVMAGGHDVAFPGLLEEQPGKYSRVLDERRGYIRFTLTDKTLRGEAVSVEGEVMDGWSQRLSRG